MSTAELKLEIIGKITSLEESRIIEEVKKLLDFELDDDVYRVSDAQRERLTRARKDEIINENEADSEIEKWLQEK